MRQSDIKKIALVNDVPANTIDKDWILGHILNAMYSFDEVKEYFAFKGGTCLKKCFFSDYRFSEDLDFSLLKPSFIIDNDFVNKILAKTQETCSALFFLTEINEQIYNDIPQGYEVIIKYWGADHKPNQKPLPQSRWQTSIKFDISFSEKLLSDTETHSIIHLYPDKDLITQKVKTYSFNEIVAEKLRSLVQRNRPRDIFDNWVFSTKITENDFPKIKELLLEKAQNKAVDIFKIENFVNEQKRRANKRAWEDSLHHQISKEKLPGFDTAYDALRPFIEQILKSDYIA